MVNIIGAPGCGKTTLLEAVARQCGEECGFAVLEGDVETTKDAERLAKWQVTVSQLLTSGACHLEAKLVHYALKDLPLDKLKLVIVENVGNLVCPAEFDIGEDMKIAVLSVTEGEDKPVKYPLLFREAQLALLTKVDLLPYLDFQIDTCLDYIRQVNSSLPVIQLSAKTGQGVDKFIEQLGI